jgi:hypothetical protein
VFTLHGAASQFNHVQSHSIGSPHLCGRVLDTFGSRSPFASSVAPRS